MLRRIGTYARRNHLALLCLFLITAGGTAWALERNSVRSKHIVNGQVKSIDVANNGLTAVDIKENSWESDAGLLMARVDFAFECGGACGTEYGSPLGFSTSGPTNVSRQMTSPPRSIVLRDLQVRLDAPPGDPDHSVSVTIWVNNNPSELACALTDQQLSCDDVAGIAPVPPNSPIVVAIDRLDTDGAANIPAGGVMVTMRAVNPAAQATP